MEVAHDSVADAPVTDTAVRQRRCSARVCYAARSSLDVFKSIFQLTQYAHKQTGAGCQGPGVGFQYTHRSVSHNLIRTHLGSWVDADLFGQHLVSLCFCRDLSRFAGMGIGWLYGSSA